MRYNQNQIGVSITKEGGILEEQTIIENLIEFDARAIEIEAKRKKQLKELTNRYKKEEQEIVNHYQKQIEEETREITQKIFQEAQQEVDQLKLKNKEVLEKMEWEFDKSLTNITDEIVKRIFEFKKENHG